MRMRRMSKNPTEAQIIQEGVEILSAGLLASALPQSLIEEFGITPERARKLAGEALQRYKKQQENKDE